MSNAWHQYGDYERFQIEESRFGLYTSITESGERMVCGLSYDVVLKMTEVHQIANAPDYDGRFDVAKFSSFVGGKL